MKTLHKSDYRYPEFIANLPPINDPDDQEKSSRILQIFHADNTSRFILEHDTAVRLIEDPDPVHPSIATNIRWPTDDPIDLKAEAHQQNSQAFLTGIIILPDYEEHTIITVGVYHRRILMLSHRMHARTGIVTVAKDNFKNQDTSPEDIETEIGKAKNYFARLADHMRRTVLPDDFWNLPDSSEPIDR